MISGNAQTLVNDYRPDLAKTLPNAKMAKIPLPIGPAGEINPVTRLENGIMISAKARESKNFVAMMQFIDWLWYSDAGQEFAKWGVEGTTYTKDAVRQAHARPRTSTSSGSTPRRPSTCRRTSASTTASSPTAAAPTCPVVLLPGGAGVPEGDGRPQAGPVPPPRPLTDEEREQASLWETPLKDYVTQNTLKFILGQRPLSEWDAYVAELKAKNAEPVHRPGQQGVRAVPEEQRLISGGPVGRPRGPTGPPATTGSSTSEPEGAMQ